jgi:hypothetical protein
MRALVFLLADRPALSANMSETPTTELPPAASRGARITLAMTHV